MYDSVKNFCEEIEYTQTGVSYIILGKSDGAPRFWKLAQVALEIPEKEMKSYKEKTL